MIVLLGDRAIVVRQPRTGAVQLGVRRQNSPATPLDGNKSLRFRCARVKILDVKAVIEMPWSSSESQLVTSHERTFAA